MNVKYLWNKSRWAAENAAGRDYTPAYFPAILAYLGAYGEPVDPDGIAGMGENDILLANEADLPDTCENVGAIIRIGSGASAREKKIFGYFLKDEERIPLFAPILPAPKIGNVLYFAEDTDGLTVPVVIQTGDALYDFRFDLCATVWYSGDGFSDGQPKNGFFIGRTPDTRPLPPDTTADEPYNDHLLDVLSDIFCHLGVPMLAKLPPLENGTMPDFALHISGDDDFTSAEFNLHAARVMHDLGLPYHINAMPGGDRFIITREQAEELEKLDTELALHTDFIAQPYTADGQNLSYELFTKYFGFAPSTNVNHCLIQAGMAADRLRWLADCGIIADNGKLGEIDPADINAFNLCGFSFGSSFPRYTCDDAAHGNAWISCMEIPINYYEPRLGGRYQRPELIKKYINRGVEDGRIVQFFDHPHYLQPENPDTPYVLAAFELAMSHWKECGYQPLLTTTNRIAAFWQARSQAVIHTDIGNTSLTVECDADTLLLIPDGMTITSVDDEPVKIRTKKNKAYIHLTAGRHVLS